MNAALPISKFRSSRAAVVTFDLDDTLWPVVEVVEEAGDVGQARAKHGFGTPETEARSALEANQQIAKAYDLPADQASGSEAYRNFLTHRLKQITCR